MNQPEMSTELLEILVNGQPHTATDPLTIDQLLAQLEIRNPAIAIELNEQLVMRADYEQTRLRPGDHVEIVTLAGGG